MITIWKDGTWKVWDRRSAELAANDPDWLVNIEIKEVLKYERETKATGAKIRLENRK